MIEGGGVALLLPEPGLRPVKQAHVATDLQLAIFSPDLGLVDLAVLGVEDGATLVALPSGGEILDDDEPDDRFVFLGARALGADLRLALLVVWLGQAHDLAEELAALVIDLDHGFDLAALLVDGAPPAER